MSAHLRRNAFAEAGKSSDGLARRNPVRKASAERDQSADYARRSRRYTIADAGSIPAVSTGTREAARLGGFSTRWGGGPRRLTAGLPWAMNSASRRRALLEQRAVTARFGGTPGGSQRLTRWATSTYAGGMDSSREFEITLVPEPEGGFNVFVPELPSVATQGVTREEAFANAKEAIELYLEVMAEEGLALPAVERGRVAVGV